jgi:hypothetical protein
MSHSSRFLNFKNHTTNLSEIVIFDSDREQVSISFDSVMVISFKVFCYDIEYDASIKCLGTFL